MQVCEVVDDDTVKVRFAGVKMKISPQKPPGRNYNNNYYYDDDYYYYCYSCFYSCFFFCFY